MNSQLFLIIPCILTTLAGSVTYTNAAATARILRRAAAVTALTAASTAATASIMYACTCTYPHDTTHPLYRCVTKYHGGFGKFMHLQNCHHTRDGLLRCNNCRKSPYYRALIESLSKLPTMEPPVIDGR